MNRLANYASGIINKLINLFGINSLQKSMQAGTFFFCMLIIVLSGCKDDESNPEKTPVRFEVPPGFPSPVYQFIDNQVTDERFELGRKLFYDEILSRDYTISCGSCHIQAGAFSHIDHRVSHGIDQQNGTRNAPPVFNLAWHSNFFWDGGVNHIELQPINPIQNPVEMDLPLATAIGRLQASPNYRSLFNQAYGTETITSQLMLRALAQFMAVMVSANSDYDRYVRGETSVYDAQEVNGLNIFRQKCESCHKEPLLTDLSYRNNGLDSVFTDHGRMDITQDPQDDGKFKVPSLRNIAVTYPYMHDGSIKSLEKVIEHYSSEVKNSPSLDPLLSGVGIPLTSQEKSDLIRFLNTLTDNDFLNNTRYSEVD